MDVPKNEPTILILRDVSNTLRSQRDMHPLKKEVWILVKSSYATDLGGPQKCNFRSGSPRTVTSAPWKNLSNLLYL